MSALKRLYKKRLAVDMNGFKASYEDMPFQPRKVERDETDIS